MHFHFYKSFYSTFGGLTSLAARNRARLTRGFETYNCAVERSSRTNRKIETGEKRPHNHVGDLANYVWNSEDCLAKVFISTILELYV